MAVAIVAAIAGVVDPLDAFAAAAIAGGASSYALAWALVWRHASAPRSDDRLPAGELTATTGSDDVLPR